jgi:hypothetical protein
MDDVSKILADLSEEERGKFAATLGSPRMMTRADVEAALRHDREWSAGLSPWCRWVARRTIGLMELVLGRWPSK